MNDINDTNDKIVVTPRTGRFAGEEVFTNREGCGIFTKRPDGTHLQHTGTSQTPRFQTAKQLAGWLRLHYSWSG